MYSYIYSQLSGILKCAHIVMSFKETNDSCRLLTKKWNIVVEMVKILKAPYQTTIVLQKENFTLSDLRAAWCAMVSKIEKHARKEVTGLAASLLKAIEKRQPKLFENPAMICALMLDPRFCNDLEPEKSDSGSTYLLSLWERLQLLKKTTASAIASLTLNDADSSDEDITILNTTILSSYSKKRNIDVSETVFESDISEVSEAIRNFISTQHQISDTNIIQFWENNKHKFPELYEMSKAIYAIAPTQAIVERSFSVLSHVFSHRRYQLKTDLLKDILTICFHKDLFGIVNHEDLDEI